MYLPWTYIHVINTCDMYNCGKCMTPVVSEIVVSPNGDIM